MSPPETTANSLRRWLVGESDQTTALRQTIARLARTDLAIWIEGETGVGKEQVALAIHAASGRSGPFVAVNVCAIAPTLFESAFFGHAAGAFTGARLPSRGFLAEADQGTIFLDEISGLPLEAQAKLLRAVETRAFRPMSARTDSHSRFRVLAASNTPLETLVREGRFRTDLAYRLRGSVLHVRPLRDRPADLPELAAHFLGAGAGDVGAFDAGALEWLQKQHWLGNVRELRQVLSCAQMLAGGREVMTSAVLDEARRLIPEDLPTNERLDVTLSAQVREFRELLARASWNTAVLAAELGVDRTTVYRRMRRLGIVPPRRSGPGRDAQLASRTPIGHPSGAHGELPIA